MIATIHGEFRLVLAVFLLNLGLIAAAAWAVTHASLVIVLPLGLVASLAQLTLWGHLKHGNQRSEFGSARSIDGFIRGDRHRSSIRDESTGLYSRWYLERRLKEEAERCKRYGHSMAVIVMCTGLVKLSAFSTDEWQERSSNAAQRTLSVLRNVDLSAALSPFEFAICLVHCDREGAEHAIERLLVQLPEYTCEAGIVVYPDEGFVPEVMIELARTRMGPQATSPSELSRPA